MLAGRRVVVGGVPVAFNQLRTRKKDCNVSVDF
jgi:hypothetical protein